MRTPPPSRGDENKSPSRLFTLILSAHLHVRPAGVHRTCGWVNENELAGTRGTLTGPPHLCDFTRVLRLREPGGERGPDGAARPAQHHHQAIRRQARPRPGLAASLAAGAGAGAGARAGAGVWLARGGDLLPLPRHRVVRAGAPQHRHRPEGAVDGAQDALLPAGRTEREGETGCRPRDSPTRRTCARLKKNGKIFRVGVFLDFNEG